MQLNHVPVLQIKSVFVRPQSVNAPVPLTSNSTIAEVSFQTAGQF